MAIRQYIGARYVPKVIGEWDNNISYEALSIVTNLGNSYTSKKPVPIGVDIHDDEYWVLTGNYSGQLQEILNTLKEYINVTENGVKNDGSDCTVALQALISANPNRTLYFPSGDYGISATIKTSPLIDEVTSMVFDSNAKVINLGINDGSPMFSFGTLKTPNDFQGINSSYVFGGVFDCKNFNCDGIEIDRCFDLTLYNVTVNKCKNTSFKIGKDTAHTGDASLINCRAHGTPSSNGIAIELNSTDNQVIGFNSSWTAYGVVVNSGGQMLTDIHPVYFHLDDAFYDSEHSAIKINSYAGVLLDNIYADNYPVGIYFNESNDTAKRVNIKNVNHFWYSNVNVPICCYKIKGNSDNVNGIIVDGSTIHFPSAGIFSIVSDDSLIDPAVMNSGLNSIKIKNTTIGNYDVTRLANPISDLGNLMLLDDGINYPVHKFSTGFTVNTWTLIGAVYCKSDCANTINISSETFSVDLIMKWSGTPVLRKYTKHFSNVNLEIGFKEIRTIGSDKVLGIYIKPTTGNLNSAIAVSFISGLNNLFKLNRDLIGGNPTLNALYHNVSITTEGPVITVTAG